MFAATFGISDKIPGESLKFQERCSLSKTHLDEILQHPMDLTSAAGCGKKCLTEERRQKLPKNPSEASHQVSESCFRVWLFNVERSFTLLSRLCWTLTRARWEPSAALSCSLWIQTESVSAQYNDFENTKWLILTNFVRLNYVEL